MMRVFVPAGVLWLAGCAGYGEMVNTHNPGTVLVTWIQQKPLSCGAEKNAIGCATITKDNSGCVIEMDLNSSDFVVAHEFKHCFGFVHKK